MYYLGEFTGCWMITQANVTDSKDSYKYIGRN